jgi:hypothetical protein
MANSECNKNDFEIENNARKDQYVLWDDFYNYASNLNRDWMLSQDIFNRYLVPTAENNPDAFVEWVNNMVEVSGVKLKCKASFSRTLYRIKRLNFLKRSNRAKLKIILVSLFNSGLSEPQIAKKALECVKSN